MAERLIIQPTTNNSPGNNDDEDQEEVLDVIVDDDDNWGSSSTFAQGKQSANSVNVLTKHDTTEDFFSQFLHPVPQAQKSAPTTQKKITESEPPKKREGTKTQGSPVKALPKQNQEEMEEFTERIKAYQELIKENEHEIDRLRKENIALSLEKGQSQSVESLLESISLERQEKEELRRQIAQLQEQMSLKEEECRVLSIEYFGQVSEVQVILSDLEPYIQ